jgi:hypothetical protein
MFLSLAEACEHWGCGLCCRNLRALGSLTKIGRSQQFQESFNELERCHAGNYNPFQ